MKLNKNISIALLIIILSSFNLYSEPQEHTELNRKYKRAKTTLIVYMAADNDLRSFAARNIKQMAAIGSNEHLHIAIHLDIRITGNKKITRRYYIEQDKIYHMNANDPETQQMDSGQPETLISACKWAIENFPAEDYVLIFWNHGTGVLDPVHGRVISPTELFSYNPELNMLELDRSTSILQTDSDYLEAHDAHDLLFFVDQAENNELEDWRNIEQDMLYPEESKGKGICWDDSVGNYLTNQKLDAALTTIRQNYLNNKKFAIIGFDACLMAMVEVADLISKHAHIMVGSQEVELGTGWNYQKVLEPFLDGPLTKEDFAKHIVQVYQETYNKITNDYTQSAISLDELALLHNNIDSVADQLLKALQLQKDKAVLNAIRASKNKLLCTHFDEPSYIDLHHLYTNLTYNLKHFAFTDQKKGKAIIANLKNLLDMGRALIRKLVLANICGQNLKQASGISIYFPERRIHTSYPKSPFGATNKWCRFIEAFTNA